MDRATRYLLHIAWSEGTAAQPLATPEASLSLHETGNSLLQLPRPYSLLDSPVKRHETICYPVVAQVTAYLGMRVISLRSTVRVSLCSPNFTIPITLLLVSPKLLVRTSPFCCVLSLYFPSLWGLPWALSIRKGFPLK